MQLIDAHVEQFGQLDVLINNAGDVVRRSAFEQLDDDLIDSIIALNARSVVTACRLAVPHFLRQGHGNIINTTSLAARQSGGPGSSVYTASKGFAQSLTRFLAREYAPHNVRVNAVAPGLILTPLQDRNTTPEQLEVMVRAIPMGRAGRPEDCVGAYLFLATDALSGFITGATIDVNGGAYMG
jgi:3-oxoacyl-[acyl-carrier protein] reductase